MSRIESPHVVRVLDWGKEPCEYLVMEYLQGEDLAARLARSPKVEWLAVRELAIRICKGLSAAHAQGVAHRDLKPSNCFVCSDGSLKLLDFGLALIKGRTQLTQTDEAVGTMAYMAPECFKSRLEKAEEPAVEMDIERIPRAQLSDLYALGVILYEMVTGQLPYVASDALGQVLLTTGKEPPRPPTALGVKLPPSAEALILKLLEKDPKNRFQSVEEVLAILEGVAIPVAAPKIHWRWVGAALMVALCTGGILTWRHASWRPPSDPVMPLVHFEPPPRVAVGALPASWADPFEMQPAQPVPVSAPVRRAHKKPDVRAPQIPSEEPPPEDEENVTNEPIVPPPRPPETRNVDFERPSLDALVLTQVERCRGEGRGLRVVVTFTVDHSGTIAWVRPKAPHANSAVGRCIETALRGVHLGVRFKGTHLQDLKL